MRDRYAKQPRDLAELPERKRPAEGTHGPHDLAVQDLTDTLSPR